MSYPAHWLQVDMCSIRPSDQGDGFVMEITRSGQEAMRLKFPACVIQQLMRTLPHIDAAVQVGRGAGSAGLIAYPLLAWKIEGVAGTDQEAEGSVVVQLRDDRFVDTSLDLDMDTALALQQDLGLAIAQARSLAMDPTGAAAAAASRRN